MFSHDWWLYILVTGAGGLVKCDPSPHLYRQHKEICWVEIGFTAVFRCSSFRGDLEYCIGLLLRLMDSLKKIHVLMILHCTKELTRVFFPNPGCKADVLGHLGYSRGFKKFSE